MLLKPPSLWANKYRGRSNRSDQRGRGIQLRQWYWGRRKEGIYSSNEIFIIFIDPLPKIQNLYLKTTTVARTLAQKLLEPCSPCLLGLLGLCSLATPGSRSLSTLICSSWYTPLSSPPELAHVVFLSSMPDILISKWLYFYHFFFLLPIIHLIPLHSYALGSLWLCAAHSSFYTNSGSSLRLEWRGLHSQRRWVLVLE